jgi:glycosyltransferase involved in cell wall biosynthesis
MSSVSVVIPVYGSTKEQICDCVESVLSAVDSEDDITVVINQPEKIDPSDIPGSTGSRTVVVRESHGMVGDWNFCLAQAKGDLVHLIHCDDRVSPNYYSAMRKMFSIDEGIVVAATASPAFHVPRSPSLPMGFRQERLRLLKGLAGGSLLWSVDKPEAGSFVVRRRLLQGQAQWFLGQFPYCPDEELYPRLAAAGTLAFLEQPLYFGRVHRRQARHATWMKEDFVDVYFGARAEGARHFGIDGVNLALAESARRVLSVVNWLLMHNERRMALWHLRRLATVYPSVTRGAKFQAGQLLARSPGSGAALRVRSVLRSGMRRHAS